MFRDYGISLKQTKDPILPRGDVVEFYVRTNAKELEKNIKLHSCPSELQEMVKELVTLYWDVFCEDVFRQPILLGYHIQDYQHYIILREYRMIFPS